MNANDNIPFHHKLAGPFDGAVEAFDWAWDNFGKREDVLILQQSADWFVIQLPLLLQ